MNPLCIRMKLSIFREALVLLQTVYRVLSKTELGYLWSSSCQVIGLGGDLVQRRSIESVSSLSTSRSMRFPLSFLSFFRDRVCVSESEPQRKCCMFFGLCRGVPETRLHSLNQVFKTVFMPSPLLESAARVQLTQFRKRV